MSGQENGKIYFWGIARCARAQQSTNTLLLGRSPPFEIYKYSISEDLRTA